MAERSLHDLGEIPPLGEVPGCMLASTIHREHYGPPGQAFAEEEVDVPPVRPEPALVLVMATACAASESAIPWCSPRAAGTTAHPTSSWAHCRRLGAVGVIDRREFDPWGRLHEIDDAEAIDRFSLGARAFGRKIRDALGERRNPAIVFEHSGEDMLPTWLCVCDHAGMVVVCGGTSGYNAHVDLRLPGMRQKRLQSRTARTASSAWR